MSRELIFRRRHKEGMYPDIYFDLRIGKSYFYLHEEKLDAPASVFKLSDKWHPIDQFTGLRDCNGKMIFENDVVKGFSISFNIEIKGVMKFDEDHLAFAIKSDDGSFCPCKECSSDLEIIGNVHEGVK